MDRRFSVQRGPTRIVFGAGSATMLAAEMAGLGMQRVMVVCSPARRAEAERQVAGLGPRVVGVWADAREHVPAEVAAAARAEAARLEADAVLAYGGGSAIGLAKAVALTGQARVVAVPTTYSGSEVTPIWGVTEAGVKQTGRDERVRPALVVYDPDLLAALPAGVAVSSAWNALAHAAEALWTPGIDRATALAAEAGAELLVTGLLGLAPGATTEAAATVARTRALEGAYLAGAAFGDVGAGLHHGLCHLLGGLFALPHAATHAALLPHVARLLAPRHPEAMAALGRALQALDPVAALARLARDTSAPSSLRALGMPEEGVALVLEAVRTRAPAWARALDEAALTALLHAAWAGSGAVPAGAVPGPPALRAPAELAHLAGFGSTLSSEALPGALPARQNTPLPPPRGLYPELLNGTPFTVKSAQNSRVWMYRVRASFAHTAFAPLPAGRFAAPLGEVEPNRTRWKPLPLPQAPARVDFLDGLVTLGGAGDAASGPGFGFHLYAANADMADRCFSTADGDLLIVPQEGTLDIRTELGWLRAAPGTVVVIPRSLKFAVGLPEGIGRGWMLEVYGSRLRLPERGPIGSNGMADARHFQAPVAAWEDRLCPGGYAFVSKIGGRLHAATQAHSPFDVVAWHGNHVPFSYDLSLFNAMGSVTWDHPDPSILTVLTAPLDDHGRAIADFVAFVGRWEVSEHSFRPPFMHRNAASEINMVVRAAGVSAGYQPGCTFISPLLTAHGITAAGYDHALDPAFDDKPHRIPDESLWVMFESALPFRTTAWARQTPLVDEGFLRLFDGMRDRFTG